MNNRNKPKCDRPCFANSGTECEALTEAFEACPFFKTPEKAEEDRRKATDRILSLPDCEYIYNKYYGKNPPNKKCWRRRK